MGENMLLIDEILIDLKETKRKVSELREAVDYENSLKELKEIERKSQEADFWNDAENANKVMARQKQLKDKISGYISLADMLENVEIELEIYKEEPSEESEKEISECYDKLLETLETVSMAALLNGEYDANNAILTFHAGAGGTEAQDWAMMLYRMYSRWAERHGYKTKIIDWLDGDEAGIKSAQILIDGTNAYGFLKSEAGVHRLVRISPFDSSGRRHTSFASLEVMPEIDDDCNIEIDPQDLKIDTYRSGGAGGQHVNKTDSAVRITHLPTGIVVSCQNERSQHQNKDVAMKVLRSKLVEIKEREHLEKIEDIKGVQKEIAWGSQIRSYVFMPYTMAKDHRTGFEMGNINAVMDGDIDGFINEYLKLSSLGKL